MKIAIVHDDFLQWGGAERVVQAMTEIWPKAPVFTSFADPEIVSQFFPKTPIVESPFKHIPFVKHNRRAALPIYPLAFSNFYLRDFDVILSSTTRFAHTIRYPAKTLHIAYCHTPPRYFWDFKGYIKNEKHSALLLGLRPFISYLQKRDRKAAKRVDHFIANSKTTKQRIKTIYNRDSTVIPPFVDTTVFNPAKNDRRDDYFLVVSRLLPWKRIDIAIEACHKINKPLVIIGKGPDLNRLKKLALHTDTVFIDSLTDSELCTYYRKSMALLQPQEEDFGMTALESQACGTSVIAFGKGGALETVINRKTGLFFAKQTADSLAKTLTRFSDITIDRGQCRANALQFTKNQFKHALKQAIKDR